MKNKLKILLSVFVFIALLGVLITKFRNKSQVQINSDTSSANIISQDINSTDHFEYSGKEGIDALTLLKQKTTVEQNSSGLVVSIANRKADDSLHEFWSFYINGESAQVGPASYITKDTDIINWKIEKY